MHEHRDDRGEGELTLWGLDGQGELPAGQPGARRANVGGTARVMSPRRDQVELCAVDLKSLLAADHPARTVWAGHDRLLLGLHFGGCYLCLGSGASLRSLLPSDRIAASSRHSAVSVLRLPSS